MKKFCRVICFSLAAVLTVAAIAVALPSITGNTAGKTASGDGILPKSASGNISGKAPQGSGAWWMGILTGQAPEEETQAPVAQTPETRSPTRRLL